jgi:hypothetical protein
MRQRGSCRITTGELTYFGVEPGSRTGPAIAFCQKGCLMNTRGAFFTTIVGRAAVSAFALLALMQLVPYGRDHVNPPTMEEPRWVSAESRLLAKRACFDCHSNETRWPWYSNIAPVSWLVQGDVEEGRRHFNLSEWNRPQKDAREAIEKLREGEMPPSSYLPLHPEARLSTIEREHLIDALTAIIRPSIEQESRK